MHYIENSHLFDDKILDQKNYFQSLFQEVCRRGLISDEEISRIQIEMIELMGKEVERYTNDESSSVRVEKAQEILLSITYSIGYYLKITTDVTQRLAILRNNNISEMFYQGMEQVAALRKKAEKIYQKLMENRCKIDNYAYQDTLTTGLPAFFHDYNIEFGAHEIPAMIDYPLYEWKEALLGAEYIYDYLTRFMQENLFLGHFSEDKINHLLKAYAPESEHNLTNIFELVLTQAIGCILAGKSCLGLCITTDELEAIHDKLTGISQDEMTAIISQAYRLLVTELEPEAEETIYVRATVTNMVHEVSRHIATDTLNRLFLTQNTVRQREIFIDGILMKDEDLRKLIEELRNISTVEEKITLVRQNIQNTADLAAILEECFYEEEYAQVIASFGEKEKAVLRRSIRNEYPEEFQEDFEPEKVWQRLLFGKN